MRPATESDNFEEISRAEDTNAAFQIARLRHVSLAARLHTYTERGRSASHLALRESVLVQVFGRRNDGLSTRSEGRRPKSAKARNRGLGGAAVPQLWGFRRGLRR